MSAALDEVLARSPIQSAFEKGARNLAVLAYHEVSSPQQFAGQLDLLIERYRPITPSLLNETLARRTALPPRSVLITFDDAGPSLLEHALPLLRARRLSAVAFAVAGLVGTDRPFWWQEAAALHDRGGTVSALDPVGSPTELVRKLKTMADEVRNNALGELRASAAGPPPKARHLASEELAALEAGGIEIGNHTLTHPILTRCPEDKVHREVTEAHERLAEMLGRPPRFFAYPNGNRDPRAEHALRELGYAAAFLFDHRRSAWPPPDPLWISRLRVGSETSLDRFRLILSGLHPALHRLLGRS